jgi:hypothetical protein
MTEAPSFGIKQSGSEADHSSPSCANVKKAWSYISTSPCDIVTWCSVGTRTRLGSQGYLGGRLVAVGSKVPFHWQKCICHWKGPQIHPPILCNAPSLARSGCLTDTADGPLLSTAALMHGRPSVTPVYTELCRGGSGRHNEWRGTWRLIDKGEKEQWEILNTFCWKMERRTKLLKNAVFWDVAPCRSCKNLRFGGSVFSVEKISEWENCYAFANRCKQAITTSARIAIPNNRWGSITFF